MDYMDIKTINFYQSDEEFFKAKSNDRIILITTKANKSYHKFKFKENDMLLFGRESAGVPKEVHAQIKEKLKVPLSHGARSLNVAVTVAILTSEALRQINYFK